MPAGASYLSVAQPSFWEGAARAFDLFGLLGDFDCTTLDAEVVWESDWGETEYGPSGDGIQGPISVSWDAQADCWQITVDDPRRAPDRTQPGSAIRM